MFEGNTKKIYSSVKDEYNALKNGSGVRIIPDAVIIHLTGKETLDFLHRVSTNEIKELKPFEKKNTLFLNEKGRLIDKTTLVNFENFCLLIGNPDPNKKLFSWINKYIIMEDIQTKDVTDDYLLIELIGPQTESYLTLLIGDEIKNLNSHNVLFTHADGFSFYLFNYSRANGVPVYKILIDKNRSSEFIDYMLSNKSVFDVCLVGDDAYNIFRIENGIASVPNEINDNYNPHETNLIGDVSFSKGCYIGQEVVARLDTYDKVQRKMLGIIFPVEIELNGTAQLFDDENNEAGNITSMAYSDFLKKPIALGFVRKKMLNENNRIFTEINGKKIQITTCELPFKK